MPKRLSKKKPERDDDGTQSAFRALQHVIDQSEGTPKKASVIAIASRRRKNPAAVALGRKGGLKSAAARMEKIPEAERRRIASAAARARWDKERGDD